MSAKGNWREVPVSKIADTVERLAIEACCGLPEGMRNALETALANEESATGREALRQILENNRIAGEDQVPICQDTGQTVIFVELGQDVHLVDGDVTGAINAGVARGYINGYLRKSCVSDPLFLRQNTGNNTPAIIHYSICPGDRIRIRVAPKGAGSENKSVLKMLLPGDGPDMVKKTVLEAVAAAGPSACPPFVVGVGIGGNMELACLCAKQAACRDVGTVNPDPPYAALEKELLNSINATGIGPQGLGGRITAVAVHVEWRPTHIASLPCAVNINCNAARHAEAEI